MASKYWLKLYHEMLDDPKVMTLRPALRWRFIETLLVAGEIDEGGKLPDIDKYAWRVRDNAEIVETELAQLADAGLLSKHNGGWIVTKFVDRQSSVDAAERMRRMRERNKKQEYYDNDTPKKRQRYDDVTKRNTDIDKDIDKEKIYMHGGIAEDVDNGFNNSEECQKMVTAIANVVKETLTPENRERFNGVADGFMSSGITLGQVDAFGHWWKENGQYKGRPALTSMQNQIKNSVDGVTVGTNGSADPVYQADETGAY